MRLILLAFSFTVSIHCIPGALPACLKVCPPGWKKIPLSGTDHCYLLPPKPIPLMDFWSMQNFCKSQQPTSYIIELNSLVEELGAGVEALAYLFQYIASLGDFWIWLGGYYQDGAWHWLDGTPWGFSAIIPKLFGPKPANGDCLFIDPKGTATFWSYRKCSDTRGATACEMLPIVDCGATTPMPTTTPPYGPPNCDKTVSRDMAKQIQPGYLAAPELMTLEDKDLTTCSVECLYYNGCYSFDISSTGVCRLLSNNVLLMNTCADLTDDPAGEWQHYDLLPNS